MKKKPHNLSQHYKMPHMFRDDLEYIESIIKSQSPTEYKLESKDYEYKSIKEIPQDEIINNFHIQVYDPYLSLDFKENSANIYASDDNIKITGVVKKISDIISKRERKLLWYLSTSSTWFAPGIFLIAIQLLTKISEKGININRNWIIIIYLILILLVIWWIIGFNSSIKKFSVIEFSYRKNKSNFFIRNKDQIIVGTIVAVITVFLTLLFQKLFK